MSGLLTKEKWVKETMGLTLKNVTLSVYKDEALIYKELGELLFTHFGISGPIVLTASRYLLDTDYKNTKAVIDLKPALDEETLYKRITSDFEKNSSKIFINSLDALLPKSLIPIIVRLSELKVIKLSIRYQKMKEKSYSSLKNLTLTIKSGMDMEDAIVTKGGINVSQINPSTMESKITKHVFFRRDNRCDASTGGYNLTIAFSTGYLAGQSIY